jgi:DtxR family Mn-dependent transcriptional regulator
MKNQDRRDEELLEAIWTAEEENDISPRRIKKLAHVDVREEDYLNMERSGLIERTTEKIILTDKGREQARALIRRHRLAERLLYDILHMEAEDTESTACEFEHILAPQVTESICTLLGHPRECPHGLSIPEGSCCLEARRQVQSLVVPLTELSPGETARVAYISTPLHARLHKLISLGVSPGVYIKAHQKYPSIIIQCENTELALEEEVAKDIYVWRGG